jgi:plastocyanin
MPARYLILISTVIAIVCAAFAMSQPASAGGGACHKGQPVTDERSSIVTITNNCFVATITRVDEGATITFVNEDDAPHTVTGANFSWGQTYVSKGNEPEDPYLAKGDRFEQTFDDSGVYPYFCFLHPGMVGAVVVGDGEGGGTAGEGADRPASLAISEKGASASDNGVSAAAIPTANGGGRTLLPRVLVATGALLLVGIVRFGRTLAARRVPAG